MTYDPTTYWRERGAEYEAKFRHDRYAEQELVLASVLDDLDFRTVLEVGCGFGRIGATVRGDYTGIDLSPDMLASARKRMPDATLIETSLDDFTTKAKYDLVLAVEMLMHVPPADVAKAIRKLDRLSARYIVTCDWTTPLPRMKVAAHNFIHDYPALLSAAPFGRVREVRTIPVGLQTIHIVEKYATGGPVSPVGSFIVGESGPEVVA